MCTYMYYSMMLIYVCIEMHVYVCVYVCMCHGILFSHKKNKVVYFAAIWMELEAIILSEITQK